jgi:hypothetical protein
MMTKILNLLLMLAVIVAALGFVQDLRDVSIYACGDLVNRIATSRYLVQGFDPYSIKSNLQQGKSLEAPASTVTPTNLSIISPIARLPYRMIRYIWLLLSWILLILSIQMFASNAGSGNKSKAIWFISLFFICGSYACRLYMDRGQIYLIYLFFLSLAYF